jgi:hypothetical protein
MRILSPVRLERVPGKNLWIVLEDFTVKLDGSRSVTVPKGFETDKASVPLGVVIKRDDRHIVEAALVHDYLYVKQKISDRWIKRKQADKIFKAIMKKSGAGWLKRQTAYLGVRAGGWRYYNKRAKRIGNVYYV